MVKEHLDKEFNFVIGVIDRVEKSVDDQGRYNHEAVCEIVNLLKIAREYSLMILRIKEGQ